MLLLASLWLGGCALTPPPRASPKLRHWYEERNYCRGKTLERAGWAVLGTSVGILASAGISSAVRPYLLPGLFVAAGNTFVGGAVVAPTLIGRGRTLQRESGEYTSPCDFSGRDRPELVEPLEPSPSAPMGVP